MRIFNVIQRYWPAVGGAETYLREYCRRLVADGHQVTVATTDALQAELFWNRDRRRLPERELVHEGVRVLRFPVRTLPGAPLAYSGWRRLLWLLSALKPVPVTLLSYLARYTPWVPELWSWLETTGERYDLVVGTTICFEPLLDAGRRFARRRGIPFIVHPLTHLGAGKEPGRDALGRFYTMRHQMELVASSAAMVAQTPTEADFYRRHGLAPERIHVIGCGINPEDLQGGDAGRFRAAHDVHGPIVFCISAMAYDKGTSHTVEAMRALWRQGCEAMLILAGTVLAPFAHQLEQLGADERRRVLVLGRIDEQEKRDLLAAGDLLVMPSRTDSFGIVYLEAWFYGKPVIGARTWGIGDVISEGNDGLLVPFGDVPALAAAIDHLLRYPEERAAMGARGREKVLAAYTWDLKYARLRQLYEHLADEGAR